MSAGDQPDVRNVVQLCDEVRSLALFVLDDLQEINRLKNADDGGYHPQNTVKSAALKRRSMDLTRALAQLRRSS